MSRCVIMLSLGVGVFGEDACSQLPYAAAANGELLGPPENRSTQASWLRGLESYRSSCLASVEYPGNSSVWDRMSWTRTSFVQTQMHPYDRAFYDVDGGEYTVESWLDGLEERYGGIDSALVWPTYTNIGIDERSQYDYILSMPGGVAALRNVSGRMHARGVTVLWPYRDRAGDRAVTVL